MKKLQKEIKKKKLKTNEVEIEEKLDKLYVIPKPSYKNTLPIQIFNMIISLPVAIRWLVKYKEEKRKEAEAKKEQDRLDAEEEELIKEEMEREKEMKKSYRRKRAAPLPSYSGAAEERVFEVAVDAASQGEEKPVVPLNTGPWTDEDLTELAKLMKKYPVGTTERWEKIAEALNRSVTEANYGIEGVEEQTPGSCGWTQKQQKSLETALACYTKGCSERWERIAKAVPDKTKEECMMRLKYLSDLVKKKKHMEEEKLRAEQEPTQLNEKQDSETIQTT
ncbi:hypothetical protein DAPPUDRAFT_261672 [Daphnia pulex]|uniref:Myb-like domain-containing protein n=1 Tax=Daphnia pulex TaxID=6669 RepID=E9HLF3_DAPPU|nr:hypothetical protein DAPPUDRAFT_261672 [Daphnia pulex]|eukprot:EFX67443.1 hypothetical protein DAPPUDRAFT_261672 [Daphnia pulex]